MTICNNCAIVQDLMPEVLKFTVRCEDCIKYMLAAEREKCAKIAKGQNAYCHNDQTEECEGGHCDMAMADAIARLIRESK